MIPTTEELAYQLTVYIDMYPEKTASELARDLGVSPLFAINAMRYGVEHKLFKWNKDKDELKMLGKYRKHDWDALELGEEFFRLEDEIKKLLTDLNKKQEDIELQQFRFWCVGIRPSSVDLVLYVMRKLNIITMYNLTDPADDKSTYEFITLTDNARHKWGKKQFSKKEQTDDK